MTWQKDRVEQLVSSLPLREAVKEKLREELWGHLASLYDEELARAGCPEAARLAACHRLGDANVIEREFAGCLTAPERIEGKFLQWITPVDALDIRAYAAAKAVRVFSWSAFGLFLIALASINLPGMSPVTALTTWVTGAVLLAPLAVSTGIAIYEIHAGADGRPRRYARLKRWLSCAVLSLAASLAAWVVAYLVLYSVYAFLGQSEMLRFVDVFGGGVFFPACLVAAVLAPTLARAYRWQEVRARKLPDWPYSRLSGL